MELIKIFFQRFFLLILSMMVLAFIFYIKSKNIYDFSKSLVLPIYTVFVTCFEISRIIAAMLYKHSISKIVPKNNNYTPLVSFVIPCKNEEKSIAKTIAKCFESNYPKDKLEVIIINDGSTDKTIDVLNSIKGNYPNLVIIDWKVNRGKRHGMAAGFKIAKGEIVVQLDSDSYIIPQTFPHIIAPFQNPEIGAVCAHADPENVEKNFLTKMQAAYYFMSFRILKAAESTFMSVFCCSGCSSAYRKSVVLPIMDQWLKERFLGLPVTWGDDRALTNWVLKMGLKTIYTSEAKALTICPENFKTFFKQQVRWKKGWFVNSIFASKFILKREPFVAITYFFPLMALTLLTPFMATRALIFNPIFAKIMPIYYVLGVFLIACLITIYYKYLAGENKYWPYIFAWSAINMIVLSFILFYALLRLNDRKWNTR